MNLTQTSVLARKAIIGGIAFLLIALVTKSFLIPAGRQAYKSLFPPKDPPNPIYGKLSAPKFEQKKVLNTDTVFELDTKTGKLPTGLPNKMAVYRIDPPAFSYEGGKKASDTAKALGFSDTDLVSDLKGDTYVWRNNTLGRELKIQINTKYLSLTTNVSDKSSVFSSGGSFSEADVKRVTNGFLNQTGRVLGNLYSAGTQKIMFGRFSGQRIIETDNPSGAQVAVIDYYRKIKDTPVYGPDLDKGLISIVVGNTDNANMKYVEAEIKNFEINGQSNATYPIVPVSQVWAAVQQNKGVMASVNPDEQSDFGTYSPVSIQKILITEVELAYYEELEPQKYLQPIYVFKGFYTSAGSKGSVAIYYPAISGDYIQEVDTPTE
ncbi:MAG: hypothetical protein WC243_02765 [Patescibacteria group bacterium]|jgi:hypothetical protein